MNKVLIWNFLGFTAGFALSIGISDGNFCCSNFLVASPPVTYVCLILSVDAKRNDFSPSNLYFAC